MNNIENVQKLIEQGQKVLITHVPNSLGIVGYPTLDPEAFLKWKTQCLYFLEKKLTSESKFFYSFRDKVKQGYRGTVNEGIEILVSLKEDLEAERLTH